MPVVKATVQNLAHSPTRSFSGMPGWSRSSAGPALKTPDWLEQPVQGLAFLSATIAVTITVDLNLGQTVLGPLLSYHLFRQLFVLLAICIPDNSNAHFDSLTRPFLAALKGPKTLTLTPILFIRSSSPSNPRHGVLSAAGHRKGLPLRRPPQTRYRSRPAGVLARRDRTAPRPA